MRYTATVGGSQSHAGHLRQVGCETDSSPEGRAPLATCAAWRTTGVPEPAASRELDRRFSAVYRELRRLSHHRLRSEVAGHTLSTTALVHETYLKLSSERGEAFRNREQFFALAARAMRRILVDYARRHHAATRHADQHPVSLSALEASGAALAQPTEADLSERAAGMMTAVTAVTDGQVALVARAHSVSRNRRRSTRVHLFREREGRCAQRPHAREECVLVCWRRASA